MKKEDVCPWDSRELGCDENYVEILPESESKEIDRLLGLVDIKLKISQDLHQRLQNVAISRGLNIKAVIREYLEKGLA